MKKSLTLLLLALFCICGYAQTIDPVLRHEMGQRGDDEKINVVVIMKSQYDRQQLERRAAHYATRAERRDYVVDQLKRFARASQSDLRSSLQEMETNGITTTPTTLWMANALCFSATKQAINDLAMRSDIEIIGYDEERYALFHEETQPASTTRGITPNVTQVNANQVWNLGYTGQGVVVAIIDSGVNYNHLDLADHLWDGGTAYPNHGYDFYYNDNNPMDDTGHGTHCAGTICGDGTAGSQTGIAPDATLMCIKVLSEYGESSVSITCNAMQWAVEHGCDVICMPIGWYNSSITERTLLRNTCAAALDAGVIGAMAAGDQGNYQSYYPIPNNVQVPGSCPPPYMDPDQASNAGGLSCVVSVGAVNSSDGAINSTSRGPVTWSNTGYADYPYTQGSDIDFGLIRPDVCAPGASITSADYSNISGYVSMSGTAMGSSCVAGCMSLLLSKNINATPAEICKTLEETAVSLSEGKSNTFGYGRVNVLAAINALYTGPVTIDSFVVDDGQGNNDGKLNAGESVNFDFTLTNDSGIALDGATMVLTAESEYVTIANGTATLPHFNAHQTLTVNDIFSFTLSGNAPAASYVSFLAEAFVNDESLGITRFNVMVYGPVLNFVGVTVLNDNNNNGALEPGETANLHVVISNTGNEPATMIIGTLSTSFPNLTINDATEVFGNITVGGQASANFNVTLAGNAPNNYNINFLLDLVDTHSIHYNVEFELWKRAITLTSNPTGAGTLSGAGSYTQGQTCTITATPNNNYAFVNWTLNGEVVSYYSTYSFTVTDGAEYVANFQQINGVAIGDATNTNSYLPTYSYYPYTLSQQIYTANEMKRQPGQIASVSFFNTGSTKTRNLTVYLVHTLKTSFTSNTDWITVTENDIVFNGSVSLEGSSWATIYFPQPFTYDGSSNLALIVDDNTGTYNSGLSCRTFSATENQTIRIFGSVTNYNPYAPTFSGTRMTQKNQVIFGYASYDCNVTVSANPPTGGTVGGDTGWHYVGQPITLTATANPGYVFNNWTKNGEIVSNLPTCNLLVTGTANYVANFQQVDGIAIGDGTNSNTYLPFYSYNPYSLSQQIYTVSEMGNTAHDISSVTLYNNTTSSKNCRLAIYMVQTNKTSFASTTDWIPVTEEDMVFNGSVTINAQGWTTINFNKIFHYNGMSNVALVVDDNTQSWYRGLSFRTFNTSGNQALYISGSGTNYDPYSSGYTGTLLSEKNQVIFGFPSYDYEVTVTVNPAEGGTVSGAGMFFQNQTCTLTATPNEGYCFYNWTKNGSVVSYNPTYTFTVTSDVNLVANFGTPLTVTVSANPTEGGNVSGGGDFGYNQSCTITATANEGYVFTKWTRNGSTVSYLSNHTFSVTTNSVGEYVANFEQVDGIAIGDGPTSNSNLPVNTYYPYSLSQQIYTAAEMNSGTCEISSVSFFNTGWNRTRNLAVYMVHTTKTAFNSSTDWISVTEANKVFSGNIALSGYGWMTIYFETPFNYNGTSNVALVVVDNTGVNNSSLGCRIFPTEGNQAIYIYGSETSFDPSNLSNHSGTLLSVKNQVIFGHPNYNYSLTVSADPTEGGTVTGGGGLYFYGQPVPVTATANPGYVFNNWTKYTTNGSYSYTQVVSCLSPDKLPATGNMEYVAHFQPMDGVVIGGAHHTNRYLPTSGDYSYSLSQQIYTAAELNTGTCEISNVSFYNTGGYDTRIFDIYMVNTNKTSFSGMSDWISVTEEDLVFSGTVDWEETAWNTIYFNTPFNYDGTSNVAMVVYDKTEGGGWSLSCRTFDTPNTQAIYAYDDYSINPNNPIAVARLVSEKNQVVFGIPSYEYYITVSADPEEGGNVSGGGDMYYYGQPVTITATPNEGYVFDRWKKYIGEYGDYEEISYLSTDDVYVTESTNYEAHFLPMDGIIIGEAAHTTQLLPIPYSTYSLSQQIFTAEEMNTGVCEISSVSFFNTEYEQTLNLDIYMVNTGKSTFDSPTDWVAVTEDDLLYSGDVFIMGYDWTTIYFSTPFNYDGESNVVLVINDKTNDWSYLSCRSFDTEGTQAICIYEDYGYRDENGYNPYNPSEYTGELLTEKNQVVFGIADYQYTVSVMANPLGAGTVSGGGGPYYYGQPIPLAAEASSGYAFSSWTKNDEVLTCFPEYILSVTETAVCVANFRQVDGILVGTPSHFSSNLPTYSYNSVTQQIFTANEMKRQPSQISSVSFFNTGYSRTRNITVYMVYTDKTSFNSGTDWITVGENDPVLFSGSFTFPTQDWATIYFSSPFNYNGLSNVALIVVDNTNSYNYGEIRCRTFDTEDNQALYTAGYNVSYDPHNLSAYSGSRISKKNQVIFGYTHYDYQVTATANPTEGGSVSGDTGWHYYGRPVTLVATAEEGYVFNNWTKNGEVVSYLSTYSFSVTETAEYVANFQQTNGILIGEGTYANYYLPTYTYYPYSLTQQIYTADELNTGSCSIASVSFFNTGNAQTRNLAVYMKHTNKTSFENASDWYTVTEEDMVFNGSVTLAANGWATIYFNTMFEYNGTSNVALIVDDNTQSWNSGLRCRTFGTNGNQAIRLSGSGSNYNPYNPTGYTGTLTSEKNQVIFGFPDYGYTVTTSANPPEGGTVSGGEGTYFMGQSCTLTATPNEGYVFNNWTLNGTVVSSSETYTFPVMGNMHLVANFGAPIMITATVNPPEAGYVTGAGGYGYNHSCTLTATANEGYVFTKWTRNGSPTSYLSTCTVTVTAAAEYVANFEQIEGIAVGDAVATNSYLPVYSYYPYSLSQQIYTADELNTGSCGISSVSFFNTSYMNTYSRIREFTVYMVHTNKTAFDNSSDWITVTEADEVFNGHVTLNGNGWVTIYFNRVFNYNGTSNIALVVDENTGSYGNSMSCRTFNTNQNQSIRVYGSGTNYDPCNPTGFTGTLGMVKNQVIFGFPEYGYTLTVSANPLNGGTVTGGGGSHFYGQPVTVSATANPGYAFKYWTKGNNVVSYFSPDNLPADNGHYEANFQQTDGLVVGDAQRSNRYLPVYSEYPYSLSQQIYTANELNTVACDISSVAFFNTSSTMTRDLSIYMVNTTKTAFSNVNDWITVSEEDKVFDGIVTLSSSSWTNIYFNTSFSYDGTSNVAMVIYDKSNEWNSGLSCRTFSTLNSQALYVYNDYAVNPNRPTTPGTLVSEKNQVIFGIPNYIYTLTLSVNPEEGGTVSGGGGLYFYGQPVTINATPNTGYAFDKWTKFTTGSGSGEVISYLSPYTVSVTDSLHYVAQFQPMEGIAIGEPIHTTQYLPSHYYYYSMTQQIYTADEMGGEAHDISSVSFYNTGYGVTRNLDIYMVNTNKSAFSNATDWVAITENDTVLYSGSVSFTGYGWTTIYFSKPFSYDGTSNVVLVFNDKTNSWNSNMSCRTFDAQGTQAIYASSSGGSFDPYNPSSYNGTLMTEKNQVVFGIANYQYTVSVSANPEEGGIVSGGGGLYYYGQPIHLAATANNGYAFSTWTKGDEVISCFPEFNASVTESAEYVADFRQVNGILVGEPSNSNSYLPTYSYNSLTQQIFTANEMKRQPCEISSVSFFNTGSARTRNLTIYMVHTGKTSFENTTDWISVTENDPVLFSGNVTFPAKGWATIYFATPFNYDGFSNVALIVDDNSNSYNSGSYRTFNTEDTQAIRIGGSNVNYDPYNPTAYTGTLMSIKNQVIFGYASYNCHVTATVNPTQSGEVGGDLGWHYYGRPITITATASDGYVFDNWTKNGEVVSYFSTYSFSVTGTAEYVANFHHVDGIAIGNPTSTNYYLPTYSYYSLTQQIYTSDEMGDGEHQITNVSFFNTMNYTRSRNLTIYMVNTDKTSFENTTDWIAVTEADKVFSGNVSIAATGWTTIYFNTPFEYDGTSNVAFIVDDNTNSYNFYTSFRTFNTNENQAIYICGSGTNYDPSNPSYTGTLLSVKNHVVFGFPTYDYTVTVTVNPAEGGTVSGGEGTYYMGQSCTLTATANPGYCFYNWTINGSVVSTEATYTFPVTGNMSLVANFGAPIGITATANPVEGGTVSGAGEFGLGHSCTLTASANAGYVFTKWTRNNSTVSYLPTYTFTVSANNAGEYVANFDQVDGIDIGNAVSTNLYLPTYSNSPYSLTQQIYTADEISSQACLISTVSFFNTGSARTRNLTVYLVQTDKTSFANNTDWITVTNNDKVFSGNVTLAGYGWATVYFEQPFLYNGSSNLALIVDDNTGSSVSTMSCRTFSANGNQTIRVNGSNINYDPCNPTGFTGSLNTVKNQVVFGYTHYGYHVNVTANPPEGGSVNGGGSSFYLGQPHTVTATPNAGYCFYNWTINGSVVSSEATYTFPVTGNMSLVANFGAPIVITATASPAEGGTVSGAGSYGATQTCTLTATANDGYVFSKWTRNGSTVSYLSTYSFTVTSNATYVAVFDLVHPDIVVGDAEESNNCLPSHSFYNYALSQQIYTAQEIGRSCKINSISFFNTGSTRTRSYTVYLKHTNKSSFGSNNDWIPVSETDQVFSGSVNMRSNMWTEITFDTPFYYDGTSNMLLVIDDNTGSYNSGMTCRVFNTDSPQALYIYDDGTNFIPYSPSYTGTMVSVKNQIILGVDASYVQQTSELAQGWNWWSTYVEITLDDLKAALVEALPGTNITIKSKDNGNTTYNGITWRGQLTTLDVAQMYRISVSADCEITLEGTLLNPAEHPITINNGVNWIGYPLNESVSLSNIFNGFAVSGDMVKSKDNGTATYNGTQWRGTLNMLVPGQGYIYKSAATGTRTFTFPTSTK